MDNEAGPSTPRREHGGALSNGVGEVDRASTPTGTPWTSVMAANGDSLTPTKPVAAPPLDQPSPLGMLHLNGEANTSDRTTLPARARKRVERVEASWEDVESDEGEAAGAEAGTNTKNGVAVDDKDDQWEDEQSEEEGEESDEESESGLSNLTESASKQREHGHKSEGSGRAALREYRRSRKALLLSGFSPWEHSYEDEDVDEDVDVMDGRTPAFDEIGPDARAKTNGRRLERTDSEDMLTHHDPFSAAPSTESVDAAEPAGRAHDVSLSLNGDENDKGSIEKVSGNSSSSNRRASSIALISTASGSNGKLSTPSHSKRPSLSPRSTAVPAMPSHRRGQSSAAVQAVEGHPEDWQSPSSRKPSKDRGRPEQIKQVNVSEPSTPKVKGDKDVWLSDEGGTEGTPPQEQRRGSGVGVQDTPLSKIVALGTAISSAVGYATGATPAKIAAPHSSTTKGDDETASNTASDSNGQPALPSSTATAKAESAAAKQAKANRDAKMAELLASRLDELAEAAPPFSLWDYLKEEVMATDFDSTQEMKWERVTNFIAIPFWMEKIILFGFAVCLDSFLYTFTILPLRFLVAFYLWIRNTLVWITGGPKRYLHSSHKCDMLKTLLVVLSCYILSRATDASKMYHSVRGQDVVKLYVIFNVLEIADRLCCSFGQDLLDSLFSRSTLARRKDGSQPFLRPLGFFVLSLGYILAHTLVLFYQLVTLNVAINSYDNALLTLLLSNQFVEIKGSVFKKFEKENLFQLTCADIVERFQLTLMLSAIGLRNLIEVSGAAASSISPSGAGQLGGAGVPLSGAPSPFAASSIVNGGALSASGVKAGSINSSGGASSSSGSNFGATILGPLPTSFTVFPSFSLLETAFAPVCIVLGSECLVDWLKHAFITKFNHIRPAVYGRFMDVLCRDLVVTGSSAGSPNARARKHTFVDQSPIVSRRLGFAALPLACMLVRITLQMIGMVGDDSHFDECAMPNPPSSAHDGEGDANTAIKALRMLQAATALVLRKVFLVQDPERVMEHTAHLVVSTAAWALTIMIAWIL